MSENRAQEILLPDTIPMATLTARERRGEIRRLAPGIYTANLTDAPAVIVRRNWHRVLAYEVPGAIVTDRSAPIGGPVDGVVYVVSPRPSRTPIELPGLTIVRRPGAGPQPGDIPLPGGIYLASKPRAMLDNTAPSRARRGVARTLSIEELADWVDRICRTDGDERLTTYRQQAEALAPVLGVEPEALAALSQLISAALATGPERVVPSRALTARRRRLAYDTERIARFDLLAEHLLDLSPRRKAARPGPWLPFFEAYFSNFIEGTEFDVDQARTIAIDGIPDPQRPADSHDISGTYQLLSNLDLLREQATDPAGFLDLLRTRHEMIMGGRPETLPGEFKVRSNQAGSSLFVHPELVTGTLTEAWFRLDRLDTPFRRAAYMGFVVAEVHPFTDGNGRLSRAFMSSEFAAGGDCRIIVPNVLRNDYLGGLRRLSRYDDPSLFTSVLEHLWRFTGRMWFDDFDGSVEQLLLANAFLDPSSAEDLGVRFEMPQTTGFRYIPR